jgi:hypothetical protein
LIILLRSRTLIFYLFIYLCLTYYYYIYQQTYENKKNILGFGFITFELEESANQVLLEHYISFKGKQVFLILFLYLINSNCWLTIFEI